MYSDHKILITFFFYVLSALTALSWGVYLFAQRKRSWHNRYFGIIFLVVGLLYLRNCFAGFPALEPCDIYNPVSYFILILVAPFTIFYLYYITNRNVGMRRKLLHFIPFVALGVVWVILSASGIPKIPFCLTLDELLGYAGSHTVYVVFFLILVLTFIVQVIIYFSIALVRILRVGRQYRKRGISLRPIWILVLIDFLFLSYPLICVGFMSHKNTLSFGGIGFHFFVALVITAISVLNLQLKLPLKTFSAATPHPKDRRPESSAWDIKKDVNNEKILASRIAIAFEMKEMFRQPHLRLQDLASELGTNRTYLSDCINTHFGCNFNQLVISYRINAAKELLVNTDMSIQKIIDEVGFNTRSSFYKAFKEKVSENMSPLDWRNHIRANT